MVRGGLGGSRWKKVGGDGGNKGGDEIGCVESDVWSTMHTHTTAPPLLPLPHPRGGLRYRLQRQGAGLSIQGAYQCLQFDS